MTPFATVADYEARYGEAEDEARVSALLQDATNIIASQPGFSTCGRDETWWGVLETVTCAVVHRSMMAGSYAGLSNVSQGAGGYHGVRLGLQSGRRPLPHAQREARARHRRGAHRLGGPVRRWLVRLECAV